MAHLYEIKEIVARLAGRIGELSYQLLPNGRLEYGAWRAGDLDDGKGRSLVITLTGTHAGTWCDYGGGPEDRGDALELVARVKCGGNKSDAIKWSLDWLGLKGASPAARPSAPLGIRAAAARDEETERELKKSRARALGLWLSGAPYAASPAEAYDQGRGIEWRTLGRYPSCLRFGRAVYCIERRIDMPALLIGISGADGSAIAACQVTWLDELPNGRVVKADLEAPKKTRGFYQGGAARLWRGASGKPLADAPQGETALIGEGYEDVATAVMARPDLRAFVAIGGSNVGSIALPPAISTVRILAQNDPYEHPDRPGELHPARRTLAAAIEKHRRAGRAVEICYPPEHVKDINDLVRGKS